MYKMCNIFTMLVLIYLSVLYYLIKNFITKYLFILFSIYAFIYYLYACVYYYSFPPQPEITAPNVDVNPNDTQSDVVILKVQNISELNNNFSDNCCICLDYIEPLESYKLNDCNYHLYHEECIKLYTMNNFKKCPICNI